MLSGRIDVDWIVGLKLRADLVPFALSGHNHGSSVGLDESYSAINLGPEREANKLRERLQVDGGEAFPGIIVFASDSGAQDGCDEDQRQIPISATTWDVPRIS